MFAGASLYDQSFNSVSAEMSYYNPYGALKKSKIGLLKIHRLPRRGWE